MASLQRVIVAIDDIHLKSTILDVLKSQEYIVYPLENAKSLLNCNVSVSDFILLETRDDVAAMTQIVYEIYKKTEITHYTLNIMAIVSGATTQLHPSLSFWLIDNHAAVICLVAREDLDIERLPEIIERLTS